MKRLGLIWKIVLGGAVLSLFAFTAANATHVFDDVLDNRFYAVPVEWASANGITTGTSPTTFDPDRGVTRGESVTFLKRYDDNIVQPALGGMYTKAEVDAAVAAAVAGTYTKAEVDAAVSAALLGTATIPSGTTVTGFDTFDHAVVVDNEDWQIAVQLPGRAPVDLTSGNVNFAPSVLASDDDATCTGTAAAPTAPAGKVCLYVGQSNGVDGLQGWNSELTGFHDRGFKVQGFGNGAQGTDEYLWFTWAYTAP